MSDNCPPVGETSQLSAKEEKVTSKSNRKQKSKNKWDKKKQSRKEESLAAKENTASPTSPKSAKGKVNKSKPIHNGNENKAAHHIHQSPSTKPQNDEAKAVEVKDTAGELPKGQKTKGEPSSTEIATATTSSGSSCDVIRMDKGTERTQESVTSPENQATEKCKEIHTDTNINDANEVPFKHMESKMNDLGSESMKEEHFENGDTVEKQNTSTSASAASERENDTTPNEHIPDEEIVREFVTEDIPLEDKETADHGHTMDSSDIQQTLDEPRVEIKPLPNNIMVDEEQLLNNADVTSSTDINHTNKNSQKEYTTETENYNNGYPEFKRPVESSSYSPVTTTEAIHSPTKPHSVINISKEPASKECFNNESTDANDTMNEKDENLYKIGTTYTCATATTTDPTYTVLSSEDERDQISSPEGIYNNSISSTPMVHHEAKPQKKNTNNKKKKNKKDKNRSLHETSHKTDENVSSTETEISSDLKYADFESTQQRLYNEIDKSISPSRPNSTTDNSFVTPLNVDADRFIGKGRGIDGANNSCYMDSTLFSLFYTTDVFDDRLLTEAGSKGHPNKLSKEVRSILKDSIVYPLRQGYFCPRDNVWKLRSAMKNLNGKLCGSFMDVEEFMFLLFEDALNVNEFLHYTTGTSDFMHQIIIDCNDERKFVTTQSLFEISMKSLDELKLQSVPEPALILEMPRSNRLLVHYTGIVPNVQLDLNNVMVECALDNSTTDIEFGTSLANSNHNPAIQQCNTSNTEVVVQPSFPKKCLLDICKWFGMTVSSKYRAFTSFTPNFVRPFINFAEFTAVSIFRCCVFLFAFFVPSRTQDAINYLTPSSNDAEESSGIKKISQDVEAGMPPKPTENVLSRRNLMDLVAVICIRGCHYTSFVKYTEDSDSKWLFFDSMAGGGPEVEEVKDCEMWLRELEKDPEAVENRWEEIPWGVKRIITDSHICIYKPTTTDLQRVSSESYTIENEQEKLYN